MSNDHLFSFERLDVYQRALAFAEKVYDITRNLKNARNWSDQIERAATSIVLNIAEGSGRQFPKEKRSHYNISRGSDFECVPLIELGLRLGFISQIKRDELRAYAASIAQMLTRLIQSVEREL